MVDINPVIAWPEEDPYFIDPTFQNTRKQRHAQLRSDYEASNPAFQNTRKQNHAQLREASILYDAEQKAKYQRKAKFSTPGLLINALALSAGTLNPTGNASNARQLGGMFNGDVPEGQDEGGLSYAGSSRAMVDMTNEIAAAPTEAKRNELKAEYAGFMNNHIRQFGRQWIGMPPVPLVPTGRHNPNRDPRKQSGTGHKKRMVKAKKQKGGKCACGD
jgi:hypothetical protein